MPTKRNRDLIVGQVVLYLGINPHLTVLCAGAAETVVYEVGCDGPPPWHAKPAGNAHELVPRNGTDQVRNVSGRKSLRSAYYTIL
jgi:hypothetical protein